MSKSPLVFTEEEQIKLRELESQAEGFTEFKNAVSRSLHSGQDSIIIAKLINFLTKMADQCSEQINEIKVVASHRSQGKE